MLMVVMSALAGMGQPQSREEGKAKVAIEIAEKAIEYVRELSIRAKVNVSTELHELEVKLNITKELLVEGNYSKVIELCREIIQSANLLQVKVLKMTRDDFKEELKKELEREELIAKREVYKSVLKRLEVIANKSNATHLINLIRVAKEEAEEGKLEVKQKIAAIAEELRSEARNRVEDKMEHVVEKVLEKYEKELMKEAWKGEDYIKRGLKVAIERIKEVIEKLKELIAHLEEVNASEKAIMAIERVIEHLNKVIEHLVSVQEAIKEKALSLHDILNKTKEAFKTHKGEGTREQRGYRLGSLIEIKELRYPMKVALNGSVTITLTLKNNLNESVEVDILIVDENDNVLVNESKMIAAYSEEEFEFNLTLSFTKPVCKLKLILKYDNTVIEKPLRITIVKSSRGRSRSH